MIPAERSHIPVYAKTHPGMSGKNNEDRFSVSAFRLSEEKPIPALLAIVSDGIGGHLAGEVAAEIAVGTIRRDVAGSDGSHPLQTLREAILHASQEILNQAESQPEKKGMGATCACALIIDNRLYVASVGDSRIYLFRDKMRAQLTTDHTWVQDAIAAGILDKEKAREHPHAHIIRRYLGSQQPVEPDTRLRLSPEEDDVQAEANQGMRLLPGDQLLLCSDGLTDLVDEAEIYEALNKYAPEQALDQLIQLANQRGGHDNITVVALQMPKTAPQTTRVPTKKSRWTVKTTCLLTAIFTLIGLALLVGGYFYLQHYLNTTTLPSAPTATLPAQPDLLFPTETFTPDAGIIPISTETAPIPALTSPSDSALPQPNPLEPLQPDAASTP